MYELKRSLYPFFIARLIIRPLLASDVVLYGALQCVCLNVALGFVVSHGPPMV